MLLLLTRSSNQEGCALGESTSVSHSLVSVLGIQSYAAALYFSHLIDFKFKTDYLHLINHETKSDLPNRGCTSFREACHCESESSEMLERLILLRAVLY